LDVIWYSAGRIDDKGYTVEMQIPLKSIRFASGDRVVMSVFFERTISRRMEHGSYPPLDPNRGYAFLTQMAPMEFLGLKRYTLLEVLPAATYSRRYSHSSGRLNRDESLGELSLTGKFGITPSLILDGTINPDFSQIEADAGQVDVNLRYDLFFPEKRPFFLEGSENFNIGATQDNSIQSFVHTRKIIDPKVGFKLSGKIGKKDTIASIFAVDQGGLNGLPGEETASNAVFSILRYKRTISQDGYLDLLYTGKELDSGFNRVIGPDGQIRLHQSGMLSFHVFGSFTRPEEGAPKADGHTLGVEYLYDTDRLQIQVAGQDTGRGFQADMGYVTRTGLSRISFSVTPKFYPDSSILRRIDPLIQTSHLRDHESGLFETSNAIGLTMILKGNNIIQAAGIYSTEIFQGQRFLTGGLSLNGRSQISNKLSASLAVNSGKSIRYAADPFQGRGTQGRVSLVYLPSDNLNLTLSLTYADLFRDSDGEKIYDYTIGRGRLTYQVNKYLFFRGVLEYNSYRQELLTDLLASFTYVPGTVIQLGYGSLYNRIEWRQDRYVESDRFLETRRGFFFKISYLWRL
jgi:hypothetical protein